MGPATRIRLLLLLAVLGLGIASRATTTGIALLDNYLGDGLYAAMLFLLCTIGLRGRAALSAWLAALIVGSLEVFQRSGIPLEMNASENPVIRLAARLIGTTFSYLDLLAYALGIAFCYALHRFLLSGRSGRSPNDRA